VVVFYIRAAGWDASRKIDNQLRTLIEYRNTLQHHLIEIMNHEISDPLLSEGSKTDYRTRFPLQSGSAENKNKAQPTCSKLIQSMGGMAMLNFLAITLSERIAEERELEPIYGGLNRNALVELQKELLLFAFSDDRDAFLLEDDGTTSTSTSTILYRHCELGLMTDPSYFVSLLGEHLQVLYDCIDEERVLLECATLVAELRPCLQATHTRHMQKRKQNRFNTTLKSISEDTDTEVVEDQMEKEEKNPSKRTFLVRRRHHHNAKAA
jgi:hypothetical protein